LTGRKQLRRLGINGGACSIWRRDFRRVCRSRRPIRSRGRCGIERKNAEVGLDIAGAEWAGVGPATERLAWAAAATSPFHSMKTRHRLTTGQMLVLVAFVVILSGFAIFQRLRYWPRYTESEQEALVIRLVTAEKRDGALYTVRPTEPRGLWELWRSGPAYIVARDGVDIQRWIFRGRLWLGRPGTWVEHLVPSGPSSMSVPTGAASVPGAPPTTPTAAPGP
jgi:hypothetical protein